MRTAFLVLAFVCAIAAIDAYAIENLDNSLAVPRGKRSPSPKKTPPKLPDYEYEDYNEDYSEEGLGEAGEAKEETKANAETNNKGDKKIENTKKDNDKEVVQPGVKEQSKGDVVANVAQNKAQNEDEIEDEDETPIDETDVEQDDASATENLKNQDLPEEPEILETEDQGPENKPNDEAGEKENQPSNVIEQPAGNALPPNPPLITPAIESVAGKGPDTDNVAAGDDNQEEAIRKAEKELANALGDEKIGTEQEAVPGEKDVGEEKELPSGEDDDYATEPGSDQAGNSSNKSIEQEQVPEISVQPINQVAEEERRKPDAPQPQANNIPPNSQGKPNTPAGKPSAEPVPAPINTPIRVPIVAPIHSPKPAPISVPILAVNPVSKPAPVVVPIAAPVSAPIPVPPKSPKPAPTRVQTLPSNREQIRPPTRILTRTPPSALNPIVNRISKPLVRRPILGPNSPQTQRKQNLLQRKPIRRIPRRVIRQRAVNN